MFTFGLGMFRRASVWNELGLELTTARNGDRLSIWHTRIQAYCNLAAR